MLIVWSPITKKTVSAAKSPAIRFFWRSFRYSSRNNSAFTIIFSVKPSWKIRFCSIIFITPNIICCWYFWLPNFRFWIMRFPSPNLMCKSIEIGRIRENVMFETDVDQKTRKVEFARHSKTCVSFYVLWYNSQNVLEIKIHKILFTFGIYWNISDLIV